ncbi:hypothetical protein [Pseudomonas defluvii]
MYVDDDYFKGYLTGLADSDLFVFARRRPSVARQSVDVSEQVNT